MQFRFPEFKKINLRLLIPKASGHAVKLFSDLLQWNFEERPSAQQALKYTFFHQIKRFSDSVSMPSVQNLLGDRVSRASFDERYCKYHVTSRFNTLYPNENIPPINNENHQNAKADPKFQSNELSSKQTKPKNGIKSTFSATASVTTNHQFDGTADEMISDDIVQQDSISRVKNGMRMPREMQSTSITEPNQTIERSISLNATKAIYSHAKINEFHSMNQRNNSDNHIYNKNNNGINQNQDYATQIEEMPNKNGAVLLYNSNSININGNRDFKIYNIFSKQKSIHNNYSENKENSYSPSKYINSTIAHRNGERQNSFDDEELDRLLG